MLAMITTTEVSTVRGEPRLAMCPVDLNGVAARECGVTAKRFQDRDAEYLNWVEEHRGGYVINIGRSGRGITRLHRASCWTITRRPPFTAMPWALGV